ncbi:M15 family metallopeptidase [Paenibacillus spiritus]|uniref:M15 family metallopeptidase n=1 Tax=Paenibacillus spiritus TaxID=2496557 RepID=A0A5J5GLS0_9BACL|nr:MULTISPECIES: M15 family metallopeptidase [Paenibacillus]KAA9008432.1 M15 family metallopeptidase [Paenibacillus spiritus]
MNKKLVMALLILVVIGIGWGFGRYGLPSEWADRDGGGGTGVQTGAGAESTQPPEASLSPLPASAVPAASSGPDGTAAPAPSPAGVPAASPSSKPSSAAGGGAQSVVTDPDSVTVMVNKQYGLPGQYRPDDLVYPEVRFLFKEKIEKRMMRKEAAEALERMFGAAQKDGVYLAGVSAYRSEKTQRSLFNAYAARDGEEKARTYSAVPGYSEHQTGLAIDVSGSEGKCAAESCFAGTKEAEWLAEHASEYGFIIRYPEGKESITGYKYEPWHIRYVGTEAAGIIASGGLTLEEYENAVPASK